MTAHEDTRDVIHRREAIRRVGLMLGGISFVGGSTLLTACQRERPAASNQPIGEFSTQDIAFLDEVADTMLPETSTPGAKAARTGAFMALMVTDTYEPNDQKVFREGMRKLEEASQKANGVAFMAATPQQRLALLETLDREQKTYTEARDAARREKKPSAEEHLPDQRQEAAPGTPTSITADAPAHYFRMMKELALLGYFTSEIGYTQAQRYVESPGRFEPCVPYQAGEKAWAPHA
jgi:hypothetical protein